MSGKRQRFQGAFGGIEQSEVGLLMAMQAPGIARLMFYTLRVRAQAGNLVVDGVTSLARWSGISPSSVQRALRWLQQHHVITWGARSSTGGSGAITGWGRVIEIHPSSEWTRTGHGDPLSDERTGHGDPMFSDENRSNPPPRTGQTDRENGSNHEALSRTYPEVYPEDARVRAPRSSVDEDAEDDAERRWLDERRRHGHERFTDRAALGELRRGVRAALDHGAISDDVEAALRERARHEWSNTRDARQWIAAQMDRRVEADQRERALREGIRQRDEDDASREAAWQLLQRENPGLTRAQIAQRRAASA
jgi:hypothetical protein